jgi:hypothetical protein
VTGLQVVGFLRSVIPDHGVGESIGLSFKLPAVRMGRQLFDRDPDAITKLSCELTMALLVLDK